MGQPQEVIDHINAVIEAIKAEELARFDMRAWISNRDDSCGTIACIGGFSDLVSGFAPPIVTEEETVERLGLSDADAQDLFYNISGADSRLSHITKTHAIRALEVVRDTGNFPGWKVILDQ